MLLRRAEQSATFLLTLVCVTTVLLGRPMAVEADLYEWEFNVDYAGFQVTAADVIAYAPDENTFKIFQTPVVPDGMPQYDWSFAITEVYLQLGGAFWVESGATFDGNNSHFGSLPFDLIDDFIEAEDGGELVISADFHIYVDDDGKANFDIENAVWGNYQGAEVTGIAFEGFMTVNAVPEPTAITLMLLGAVSLGFVTWRRRR